jgi:hypothetical protein
MNKRLITAIGAFAIILTSTSRVYSQEWNYFGNCASGDVILAKSGKWYSPANCGREVCRKQWEYAGKYREITKGVIEVYWWTPNGAEGTNHQKTYTHKSLYRNKCKI